VLLRGIDLSKPDLNGIASGFLPSTDILHNREMLFVAIGILGATVMPHNLYLHSSIVQTRNFIGTNPEGGGHQVRDARLDLRAYVRVVHQRRHPHRGCGGFPLERTRGCRGDSGCLQAPVPVLGVGVASTLFALALLASGQSSTLTGTLAGQIVMEGFLNIAWRRWLRRLITRLIAIVPAVCVIGIFGEDKTPSFSSGARSSSRCSSASPSFLCLCSPTKR